MAGKLIVVEGVDCSGKKTQAAMLAKALGCMQTSFPNYESYSSDAVKAYLRGDFGKTAESVNAYTAATFYATDRFISFKTEDVWNAYANGATVVSDRYVLSNAVHQAAKLNSEKEKMDFIKWISDLEYSKNGVPKEDINIFLNMPLWAIQQLNENRANKFDPTAEKDIHEADENHLKKAYDNAMFVANLCGGHIINCAEGNRIKTVEEIHQEILFVLKKMHII